MTVPWLDVVAVAVGAAAGALLRWQSGLWFNGVWDGFPLGTLLVNCLGGLMVGAALMWFTRHPSEPLRLLLVTGFLGGLTTFSAFSGESLTLLRDDRWALAFGHTLAHVGGALGCAALGLRGMRALLG